MRIERIYGCDGFEAEVTAELREEKLVLASGDRRVAFSVSRLPDGGFLLHDGETLRLAYAARSGSHVWVHVDGRTHHLELRRRRREGSRAGAADASGHGPVVSPMTGTVRQVRVEEGERVDAGQPLLVLEAMKMETEIRASVEGKVSRLACAPGRTVQQGEVLLVLEPLDPPAEAVEPPLAAEGAA